ncbi:hypothetical protein [Corynebacterium sp. MNWGS58]|uniref:hypothetical protein n=1 Tax=Corynebacterium sp. 102791.4 TaxID=3104612 RepID=UPI003518904D
MESKKSSSSNDWAIVAQITYNAVIFGQFCAPGNAENPLKSQRLNSCVSGGIADVCSEIWD